MSMRLHVDPPGLGHYRRSTIGPFGIQLGGPPYTSCFEIATPLDVTGMRGNRRITHSPKTLLYDSSYFKAVEAVGPQLRENSSDRVPYLGGSRPSKEHDFCFPCHEEEAPAGCMDLAIQGEAVEALNDAPLSGVDLTLQSEELHDPGAFFNQNRSDLYGRCHRVN